MTERFGLDGIREFWAEQARKHGSSPAASWSDQMVIELEIAEIVKRLRDGDHVLDVGCATGYTTMALARQRRVTVRGLDYLPEMVAHARARLAEAEPALRSAVAFDVGDVSALDEPADRYDTVVVVRVIINLGEWRRQVAALQECVRVLKPGGTLLLSEATVQGWQRLNRFRREWGLDDIPMPAFNNYLDQEAVIQNLAPVLDLVEIVDFASTYYVGTRVLKPLLARALGGHIDVADPAMDWNRWFAQLPAWGDYGTQKLFVLRKP